VASQGDLAEREAAIEKKLKGPAGRYFKEGLIRAIFTLAGSTAILITLIAAGIFVVESFPFFQQVSLSEFFFSPNWSLAGHGTQADAAMRSYGTLAIMADTLVITGIALLVALPLGVMSAVILAEYATNRVRQWVKPILEILAGIPTVVFGFFALRIVTPFLESSLGIELGFQNGLSAGLIMGFMILPLVSSIVDDVLYAVPRALREGAYAMGATKFEVVSRVVIPAALSGIGAAFILAMSRAIGETMIVAMAAGRTPAWPPDPTGEMMTLTTTMVSISQADFSSLDISFNGLFAIGLYLFVITLILNIASYLIVKKYREKYE